MYIGSRAAALGELPGAAVSNSPAILTTIPGGFGGVKETLRYMRDLARASVRSPAQTVRNQAEKIVAGLPARNADAEIGALHEYVRDSIRYLKDPVNVERVQTPEQTLVNMQGDCDDKSTLLASLLDSVGYPSQFVAIAINGGPFSHVLVEAQTDHYMQLRNGFRTRWIPLETIIPRDAGWWPDGVTKAYRMKI